MKLKQLAAALLAVLLLCLALCSCSSEASSKAAAADGVAFASVDELQFRQPESDALVAVFDTSEGAFSAVLYPQAAPQAVQNFVTLARQGS